MTQLDTRVEKPDNRRKAWLWTAAAALVVIAGLIAVLTSGEEPPVATDPPPTTITDMNAANLSGSWSSGPLSVVFENDQYAFVFDGILVEHGTYVTESDTAVIFYTSAEDSPGCAPGDEGRWSFETDGGSSITLNPVDDDCFFRAFIDGPEPSSMMAADSPIDVTGLPTELNLEGKWGDEATGLAITGNDYAIAIDGEVIDRGTYQLQMSPYLLVLESESTDATCATATYGLSIEGGEALLLENNRIGEDECTARSGIGMRPLESGGTFEIPDAQVSGQDGETVETPNLGGLRFVVPEDRFIHESPGLVVILDRDGEFDRGTYTINDGLLTITSGPDSNECDEGATHSSAYEIEGGNSLTLGGDVDDCLARLNLLSNAGPLTLGN